VDASREDASQICLNDLRFDVSEQNLFDGREEVDIQSITPDVDVRQLIAVLLPEAFNVFFPAINFMKPISSRRLFIWWYRGDYGS